eukprot:gene13624-18282_t
MEFPRNQFLFWIDLNDENTVSVPSGILERRFKLVYGDNRPSVCNRIGKKRPKFNPNLEVKNQLTLISDSNNVKIITTDNVGTLIKSDEVTKSSVEQPTTKAVAKKASAIERKHNNNATWNKNSVWNETFSRTELLQWIKSPNAINIIEHLKQQKKNAHKNVITVFLSSPFDGMEEERRIFREEYATELENICAKRGHLLTFVDMRFGITSEMGNNNQTVITCMRGIDEADIVLGFYGARYGSSTLIRKCLEQGYILNPKEEAISDTAIKGTIKIQLPVAAESSFKTSHLDGPNRVYLQIKGIHSASSSDPKSFNLEFLIQSYDELSRTIVLSVDTPQPFVNVKDIAFWACWDYKILEGNGDWLLKDVAVARESYPFLDTMEGKSVTEFEFQHSYIQDNAHTVVSTGIIPKVSMMEGILRKFTLASRFISSNDAVINMVRLDKSIEKFAIQIGMNLRIKNLPLQTIVDWDEENKICRIYPGYKQMILSGLEYKVTVPKRLCGFFFRSENYDAMKVQNNPEESGKWMVENESSLAALQSLKTTIKDCASFSNAVVVDGYTNPKSAAELMYLFLKFSLPGLLINKKFKNANDEKLLHLAYTAIRSRIPSAGRETVIDEIDNAFTTGSSNTVVVYGDEGMGISTVLSWICRKSENVTCLKYFHFVGCHPGCTDLPLMVHRLSKEIADNLEFSQEERYMFSNLSTNKKLSWLFDKVRDSRSSRIFIAIDSLHQIAPEYYDGSSYLPSSLEWLPQIVPDNIFLLVSTSRGRELDKLLSRNYLALECTNLAAEHKKELCENFLQLHLKRLDHNYDPIWSSPATDNPLYLSLLLSDLITSGTWATLKSQILGFLEASNVIELCDKILSRLEKVVDVNENVENGGIVGYILSLIWCSRKGLAEFEILELVKLGWDGNNPLSQRQWLTLRYGLHNMLSDFQGWLTLSQTYIRQAVERRYGLYYRNTVIDLHSILAKYFKIKAEQDHTGGGLDFIPRAQSEMDYHFNCAGLTPPVLVAIRTRPFLPHELGKGHSLLSCVQMKGKQVLLTDPITGRPYCFTGDYAFWSCHNDANPSVDHRISASNASIWKLLGANLLQQAIGAFDVSLFAYGQTGSGKSYTMFGSEDEPGMIYLTCREIFRQLKNQQEQLDISFEIEVSMLEIYNEKVRDLLQFDPVKETCFQCRVLEDENGQTHIKGKKSVPVKSWEEINIIVQQGFSLRATSGTKMNAESSRSHCIFSMTITRSLRNGNSATSKVNLIDLAGSESGKTREALSTAHGANKLLSKEGSSINQSLSVLNNCISALAKKKSFVCFRESKLTHILKDSLCGKGKLIMLTTVSPLAESFTETLSTLNYGKTAKMIDNIGMKQAENKFLAEVMGNAASQIVLESVDKMTFILLRSCGNDTSRGSQLLLDMIQSSGSDAVTQMKIPIPRVEGRVLEIIAEYLREQSTTLKTRDDASIEEWEAEFIERIENTIVTKMSAKDIVPFVIKLLIGSIDMMVPCLRILFKDLLRKMIMRDPSVDTEFLYSSISNGWSSAKRLSKSQKFINKYANQYVSISGDWGYFSRDGDLLKRGRDNQKWFVVGVSEGKCAFRSVDGYYITAYGTCDKFEAYLHQRLYDFGLQISADIVDDLVEEISQHGKLAKEGGSFNISCIKVEKGKPGDDVDNYKPEINQMFEIHSSQLSNRVMITNFCATCWRSAVWSEDVMYSTYNIGTANRDEQILIV